jgi:transcription initiation factor TFIIIB Brf1 subunit/transcription initiation factor TFIIB
MVVLLRDPVAKTVTIWMKRAARQLLRGESENTVVAAAVETTVVRHPLPRPQRQLTSTNNNSRHWPPVAQLALLIQHRPKYLVYKIKNMQIIVIHKCIIFIKV